MSIKKEFETAITPEMSKALQAVGGSTTVTANGQTRRVAKITVTFTVPVPQSSLLGGKTKGTFTRDEQYARFYLKQAIAKLNGVVEKEELI